jgi:glycosyltransferase involved in cell wall biosynthesis
MYNYIDMKTLTIGIPAYNEENNIAILLNEIIPQKQENFVLEEVIVASDGSTDSTEQLVIEASKNNPLIKLIADGKRLGQTNRLNQLIKLNKSDVLLNLDGDCLLSGDSVFAEIVKSFDSENVGLVGGNDTPGKPGSFFEKIVVTGIELWYETRKNLNKGSSVYNHHGCVSALSKKFCQELVIPGDVIAADTYQYFRAVELGYEFKWAKNAVVYYRAPGNLSDYLKQSARFIRTKKIISGYFGPWIEKHRKVDPKIKRSAVVRMFLRKPLLLSLALLLRFYARFNMAKYEYPVNGIWQPVASTKKLLK